MRPWLLLLVLLGIGPIAMGQCTGSGVSWACPAGTTSAQVTAALASASDGAVFTFAAGAYTLNAPINFLLTKGGTLICATGATCTITPSSTPGSYTFGLPTWGGSGQYFTKLWRISGFTWNLNPANTPIYFGSAPLAVNEAVFTSIVIDNNNFVGANTVTSTWDKAISLVNSGHRTYFYGVIARNTMTCPISCQFVFAGTGLFDPFPAPDARGTANTMVVEDNTVTITTETDASLGVLDWDYGATGAMTIRHNTITNGDWTSHYPLPLYEFYNNNVIFNAGASTQDCYRGLHVQTASLGHLFNDNFNCQTSPSGIVMSIGSIREGYKVDSPFYPKSLKCTGFINHTPFSDGNRLPSQTNQGYPCLWQPGRDPATMNLAPWGVWNNTKNGALAVGSFEDFGFGQNPDYYTFHEQANREYYNSVSTSAQTSPTSPWNCSTNNNGMAFGTLANLPTGCAPYTGEAGGGFLYAVHTTSGTIGANSSGGLASDDVLYQYGARGWIQIYKPYPYPYPFFTGQTLAAFPVFSLAPGPYQGTQTVTVTTTSPSPTEYCTTDGSAPTLSSTSYTGASYPPTFVLAQTTIINCFATSASATLPSQTLSGGFCINCQANNAWPTQPGSYPAGTGALTVQINNPGQIVRNCVTIDGSDPTESSPGTCGNACGLPACTLNGLSQYSTVSCSSGATCKIKFLTSGAGFTHSPITTVQYAVGGPNGLWWEDIAGSNYSIGGTTVAENFGQQVVGTTSGTLPIFLNNPGNSASPTTVSSVTVAGTQFARQAGDGCATSSFTIAVNGNCSLLITFTPDSIGTFFGSVTISDNAAGSPHVIPLQGTGISAQTNTATVILGIQIGAAHKALLSWIASTTADVTSYNIYRSNTHGSGYVKIASVNAPTVQYLDTNVQAGHTYYYVFTSVDVNGESGFSTEVSGTIPTP